MTSEQWVEAFWQSLAENREKANMGEYFRRSSKWTELMVEDVLKKGIGKRTNCQVSCISHDKMIKEKNSEYLTIDAMFFNENDYKTKNRKGYDPFVLPTVVVEHENMGTGEDKICFCLWKLMCIRAGLRVLICYSDSVKGLKKQLEDTMQEGNLAKNLMGDLIVIVGDLRLDDKLWNDTEDLKNYFHILKWEDNKLIRQ